MLVFSQLVNFLRSLPDRLRELFRQMRTWPGRLKRWLLLKFWAFVAWLRALPGRIKAAWLAFCKGVKKQFQSWSRAFSRWLANLFAPIVVFLRKTFSQDPAKIPPAKLTISGRGRKVAIFCRQLSSMTTSGIQLLRALEILAEQADDPRLSYVATQLAQKLSQGYSLSKAASQYPKVFPPVFYHLVQSGESTGRIVEVLGRLADLLESEEELVKRVRGALSYPIFIVGFTFVLTVGLFSTVLPGFANFYRDFDVPLPALTAFLMTLTDWVRSPYFWMIFVFVTGLTYHFAKVSWEMPERRLKMYRVLVKLPLVGPIIELSALARYSWVLELTQDAGLDIIKSIHLAGLASGSATLAADSKRLIDGVTDGETVSELMATRPGIYPNLLQQLLMMGEETSRMSDACGRSATWFEQEADLRIDSFSAALEPVLMGGISIVVGTIVMAVFMPLYGLLDKLGV